MFWLDHPADLVGVDIFPSQNMSYDDRLNALTRLVLLGTLVLFFLEIKHWYIIGGVCIALLIVAHYLPYGFYTEGFSITPTYTGMDYTSTVIAPAMAEEWRLDAPTYEIFGPPDTFTDTDVFDEPLRPQSYPYGQYLTKTNLLPSDEYYSHQLCGGANRARTYANSTFLRNDLAFRDNISTGYKEKMNRRYRHTGEQSYSPFSTA